MRADSLNLEPIVPIAALVSEQVSCLIPVCHEDINVAIVIVIAEGGGTAYFPQGEPGAHLSGNIGEPPIPQIPEEQILLRCSSRPVDFSDVIHRMPVCNENVLVTVVIVIQKADAPAEVAMCMLRDARRNRGINEKIVAFVVIERVSLILEVAYRRVKSSIVIVVGESGTHPCFFLSRVAAADTGKQSDFFKSAIASVLKEVVEILVIRDVNVGIAIVVNIPDGDSEPVRRRNVCKAVLFGEGAVAVVMIKAVRLRWITARAAVNRDALPVARFVCEGRIIGVIGNVEFEKSIVVQFGERAASAPLRVSDVCCLRDIGEGGIAVVAVKDVRSEVCHIDVNVAIVIVIAGRRANPVARIAYACGRGNIGKRSVAVIAIENVRWQFPVRFCCLSSRVDEVNVKIAIVIVIKKTAARAVLFVEKPFAAFAVGVLEMDA